MNPAPSDVLRITHAGEVLPAKSQDRLDGESLPREESPQAPSRDLRGQPVERLQFSERCALGHFPGVPLTERLSQCSGNLGVSNALGLKFPCQASRPHGMTMGPSTRPGPRILPVVKIPGSGESRYHRLDLLRDIATPRQALPDLLRGQGLHTEKFDRDVPRIRTLSRRSLPAALPPFHQIPFPFRSHLPAIDASR